MSEEKKPLKIYPSSAAFAKGVQSDASYNNSCFRWQVMNDAAGYIRKSIPPIYAAMGEVSERRFEKVLLSRGYEVEVEAPFKLELADGVVMSGRIDFVAKKDGKTYVFEKKSTINNNKKSAIKHRKLEESQLAQICTYLLALKINEGYLVQTMYHLAKDFQSIVIGAEVEYHVEIKGRDIYVDGEVYKYNADDLARYYKYQIHYRKNKELANKPVKATQKYGSPCHFCPAQGFCHQYDLGILSKEQMLTEVPEQLKEAVESEEQRSPEFWAPKR